MPSNFLVVAGTIAVGLGSAGRILVVVYMLRGEEIRLISARPATRREVKDYES